MIPSTKLTSVIFFDIESVTNWRSIYDAPESVQREWKRKCDGKYKDKINPKSKIDLEYDRIYREIGPLEIDYAKVVCITIGILKQTPEGYEKVVRSIYGDSELDIMTRFSDALAKMKRDILSGFNITGYDIPFLCRKFLIHKIKIPFIFSNFINAKPWDRSNMCYDLLEYWKFGSFGIGSTFGMVCESLGVETPKTVLSGDKVNYTYHEENDLPKIVSYCEADVNSLIDCYLSISSIYS